MTSIPAIIQRSMFLAWKYKYLTTLSKALKCLPERKRNIILLSYFMDMSDAEIGELMNVVRTTVYRHRTSTLEELRKMMEEE